MDVTQGTPGMQVGGVLRMETCSKTMTIVTACET
jgi:hypothetical protein